MCRPDLIAAILVQSARICWLEALNISEIAGSQNIENQGVLGVIRRFWEMQDKRLGPFRAKLLSAHLFFWPAPFMGWAKEMAGSPLLPQETAGPNGELALLRLLEPQYGR